MHQWKINSDSQGENLPLNQKRQMTVVKVEMKAAAFKLTKYRSVIFRINVADKWLNVPHVSLTFTLSPLSRDWDTALGTTDEHLWTILPQTTKREQKHFRTDSSRTVAEHFQFFPSTNIKISEFLKKEREDQRWGTRLAHRTKSSPRRKGGLIY